MKPGTRCRVQLPQPLGERDVDLPGRVVDAVVLTPPRQQRVWSGLGRSMTEFSTLDVSITAPSGARVRLTVAVERVVPFSGVVDSTTSPDAAGAVPAPSRDANTLAG